MKKLFLSMVAAMLATVSFAQSDLVATLTHGTSIFAYYGDNALVEAVEAASEGDVITLSSGTFNGATINKALTIRGAGMYVDQAHGIQATRVGQTRFNIPDDATADTRVEDMEIIGDFWFYGNSNKYVYANRIKCGDDVSNTYHDLSFVGCYAVVSHCVGSIDSQANNANYNQDYGNVFCTNSVLLEGITGNGQTRTNVYQNCLIKKTFDGDYYATIKNCILIEEENYTSGLSANNAVTNCIGFYNTTNGTEKSVFRNFVGTNNINLTGDDRNIFENDSRNGSGCNYSLSTVAAATYLGDDNTQVGIYGGANPFSTTPKTPRITTFDAAATNNNGTLSVTINVE